MQAVVSKVRHAARHAAPSRMTCVIKMWRVFQELAFRFLLNFLYSHTSSYVKLRIPVDTSLTELGRAQPAFKRRSELLRSFKSADRSIHHICWT